MTTIAIIEAPCDNLTEVNGKQVEVHFRLRLWDSVTEFKGSVPAVALIVSDATPRDIADAYMTGAIAAAATVRVNIAKADIIGIPAMREASFATQTAIGIKIE